MHIQPTTQTTMGNLPKLTIHLSINVNCSLCEYTREKKKKLNGSNRKRRREEKKYRPNI